MNFRFFQGRGEKPAPEGWKEIPPPRIGAETLPEFYEADDDLADAVNVALLMGRPLLLTGEPGTGKTQLAFRLAWELGLGAPEVFETKSTSLARDLFYTYDALGRFHDAECEIPKSAQAYIAFNALGRAILQAQPKERVADLLPPDFAHDGPRRSVVLIDEIDKAPRDFPNDILNEIERMYFRIPELGNVRVPAEGTATDWPPIVVVTSNSEKHLPGPFLRRCVYHHIRFPKPERMARIVTNRLRHIPDREGGVVPPPDSFVQDAVALFFHLRDQLDGPLSTGELIVWMQAMQDISEAENPVAEDRESAVRAIGALVKSGELEAVRNMVREWQPNA
jgi:MoxR-like ATPase